jgi:Flp pilus assembly protein TadD
MIMRQQSLRRLGCLAALLLGAVGAGCESSSAVQTDLHPRAVSVDDAFGQGAGLPPSARTLYAMARLFASQGRDDDAERVLVKVIREEPRFMPAYCDLAELHVRHRRFDAAIESLRAGLTVAPSDHVLLNNLGMCWVLKGEYPKALDRFSEAAGAVPHNARYRANMAMAMGLMGRYEEAMALYQQVVPEADGHRNLAILCEARGDQARAARELALADGQAGHRP